VVIHRLGHRRHDVVGALVPHDLGALERAWAALWGRVQRASLTRRCIMCRDLVGDRPAGESPLYCSDACRDLHRDCGG
jgi:hypothetical protein